MIKWSEFLDQIELLGRDDFEALVQGMKAALRESDPGRVKHIDRQLNAADDDDCRVTLVLIALRLGEINAYLSYPPSDNCYRIESFCWDVPIELDEAIEAIQEGIAPRTFYDFAPQTMERNLVNHPFFILKSDVERFLNLRQPSAASLAAAAQSIVAEHQKLHPTAPMKKDEFVNKVMGKCPGCTKNRAEAVWKEHVPESWRAPGRRRLGDDSSH